MKTNKKGFIYLSKYDGPGLYEIKNLDNGRVYIGSAKNIKKRGENHQSKLKNGKHPCKDLQKDFNSGCKLEFTTAKKIHTIFPEEIKRQESETVYKRRGENLYNKMWTENKYIPLYLPVIIEKFADSFCRENLNMPLWEYKRLNEAEQGYLFACLYYPKEAERRKAEYMDGIEYLNKKRLFSDRYGIDYDEYLELTDNEKARIKYYKQEENKRIINEAKRRRPA